MNCTQVNKIEILMNIKLSLRTNNGILEDIDGNRNGFGCVAQR